MNRPLLLTILLFCSARLFGFDVQMFVQHATCGNTTGSITASPDGGVWPYTYLWSNGATTNVINDVLPGTYSVTVTDGNGDTGFAEVELIATAALFPPSGPGVDIWSCFAGCEGGFFQYGFPLNGAQPYTVTADPPGPEAYANPNYLSVYGLCLNTPYTITISDANGCTGVYGPITLIEQPDPSILSWSATPSCPDGATGTLTVLYDNIDSLFVSGPGSWFAPTSNPFTLTNLAPGEYILQGTTLQEDLPYGVYPSACYISDTLVVPETAEPCGTLNGIIFADVDEDCTQDGGEPGLPYRVLSVEPGGHLVMTGTDGTYSTQYFYGSYALDGTIEGYSDDCTTLPAAFTLDGITPTATIDLPMTPTFGPDLAIYVNLSGAVPGFAHTAWMQINNSGPYTFSNVVVDLSFDPLLSFVDCVPAPDLTEAGHLQWVIAEVAPFSSLIIYPEFSVPADVGLIGTVLTSDASITTDPQDSDPTNDTDQATRTITSSYDPNDKLAETSSRLHPTLYYLNTDTYVDYTIRFQNTGTGPAYNVYLMDTISPLLDLTSFQILASSHAYSASLGNSRDLRFDFTNIMLPDSGSDMSGSQGFISFRLKPVSGIMLGDELVNAADIYFDFNEPIRTNDAVLLVDMYSGITDTQAPYFTLFPNPVTDQFSVLLTPDAVRMDVISADGRVVLSQRALPGSNGVDARNLTQGAYSLRLITTSGAVQHARFVKR